MKIAVIGSGISGLSTAWMLSEVKDNKVTIFEKANYLGGHTNTVEVTHPKTGETISVDTGFIVYNELNYPNLVQMFKILGVKTEDSDMSFALSKNEGEFEWAGEGLHTVFAQPSNFFSLMHWRMIYDILRFGDEATSILGKYFNVTNSKKGTKEYEKITMKEFLDKNNYSKAFQEHYLLPMTAAVWSTPMSTMLEYPMQTMVQFMNNHKLLHVHNRPQWKTVTNGSREYVKKIKEIFDKNGVTVKLNCGVSSVQRKSLGDNFTITVTDQHGNSEEFDRVVFAVHADVALRMLKDPSTAEKSFLSAFGYNDNKAYLHSDISLMPRIKSCWSSWNYLMYSGLSNNPKVILSYWMNRLQPWIPKDLDLIVTLNPSKPPDPTNTYKVVNYEHPIYVPESIKAQKELQENQGKLGTYYAGAHCGYGFHEDGLHSAIVVSTKLGAKCPWTFDDSRYKTAPIEKSNVIFRLKLAFGIVIVLFVVFLRTILM